MPSSPHTAATTNRLGRETSPYLLQHANNPVDWYPWGDDAIEKAKAEDKPIFLSVGYSTCYWCHVMERRCFEDESIAELMNEHHVNIKVDREERPDVDELYMAAVQIMNQGQGGWPMSVWIDPHTLKPFYAGTYFPPESHYGRPGFPQLIQQLGSIWRERRHDVDAQSNAVADRIATLLATPPEIHAIGRTQVREAISQLMSIYDRTHGGFGGAPKFPQPVFLELLLAAGDDEKSKEAVKHTLDRMAIGGMYDLVGGGFHRYSVDDHWLVPHFEKMLYDNGQLASLYARAADIFDDDFYRQITEETLDYILREMTHEQGGFFSAQDAEVNAREGENYLWTADEVRNVLAEAGLNDLIDFALHVYGLNKGTNFRDPHNEDAGPKNVLHLVNRPEPLAHALGVSVEDFNSRVSRINEALLAARDQRDQPSTDDKILAGWNGLMIAAFAEGGRVLDQTRFIDAAERAARFILDTMRDERGELYRSYCKDEVRVKGFLEDYALLAHGLLALHRATGERNWLDAAGEFVIRAQRIFRNERNGGYFTTRSDQTDLFVRLHAAFDGAVPSGPSVMLHNLLDLYERTGDTTYLDEATQTLASLSGRIERSPTGLSLATLALHRFAEKWPDLLPRGSTDSKTEAQPVTAELNTDAISLTDSGHVIVELRLRIAEGYHINAHEPGDANLQPLQIDLEGEGARVDVKNPNGEPLENATFADAPINVHTGDIVVPLHICQSGELGGEHHIVITCQPCTDQMCLEPRTIRLPIEITPA